MTRIPDNFKDLLERPLIVSLATVMPDGQPQVTPVWADTVDGKVRINTVAGRQKHRNLELRNMATVLVVDSDDPMRWMEIRGEVSSSSEDDGIDVIDKLAKDYLDVEPYPWHNDEDTRVTFLISPTRVITSG
jgi:PPOX class probable F420-dependent enzyme